MPSVFVPDGPIVSVSTEMSYCAFACSTPAADGSIVTAYRLGSGHATPDGQAVVRRSMDGLGWGDAVVAAANPGGGYAFGPAGTAVDSTGRIWLALVKYLGTTTGAASNFSAWWVRSSDNGATWTAPVQVPNVYVNNTYPSHLYLTAAGELLMALYVRATSSAAWEARVLAWNGTAWVARGAIAISGRSATEPQLVQLADGRLMMLIRSDGTGSFYSYCYRSYSSNAGATWTTPAQILTHATGMMTPTRLADDTIAVVYRGQVSVPPSSAFPMRLAMLDAAGTVYRSGVDLTAGDFRTYLYGGIVAHAVVGNPDWLIASLEGPDGSTGSYAEVQATPLSQVSY